MSSLIKKLVTSTGVLLLICSFAYWQASGTSLQNAPDEAWAAPTDRVLHNLGPATITANTRSYECTELSYRMIDDLSKTMQTGCFVPTAFGMLDPDKAITLFNGSDEAEAITMGSYIPAISPLPYSVTVARFGGFPAKGTYMYLYNYFPGSLHEYRNGKLQRYQELDQTANETINDPSGRPMAVNPQALAYASRGQWLVTESPDEAFVRISLADYNVLPFAPSLSATGQPFATRTAALAVTDDGRYVAVADAAAQSFRVYDLAHCTTHNASADSLTPADCPSHDYWPYVASQVSGDLTRLWHIHFINDDLLSFDATSGSETNTYELSPSGPITSLISYLGLGDSYAAGQGASNYLSGTATSSNICHLSGRSYPLLLNGDVFHGGGHSVACSGATIHDITSTSPAYTGQTTDQRGEANREADGSEAVILHDFTPGYLAQQDFVRSYQPGVITVEAGGNDVGFKDMLINCVSPLASVKPLKTNAKDCYTSYEDRLEVERTIAGNYSRWVALYKQLQRISPASQIYAIGYPQIVATGQHCGLNVHLSAADIDFTRNVITYLNGIIAKAATAAGVPYADISNALEGHELCDSGEAGMNGLSAGKNVYGFLSQESYHPTAFGQALMEQAILQATNHFAATKPDIDTAPVPLPPQPSDDDPLLHAPKTGRTVRRIIPVDSITKSRTRKGDTITIHIIGSETVSLASNSTYTIKIGDTTIGSANTDSNGNLSGNGTIPITTDSGTLPVTVTGPGSTGDPVTIGGSIYVPGSDTDSDDDGIPNDQDSCPTVVNSGVDEDHDGIDDACDPLISTNTTDGGSSTGPNSTTAGSVVTPGGSSSTPSDPTTPSGSSSQPTTNPVSTSPTSPQASTNFQVTADPQLEASGTSNALAMEPASIVPAMVITPKESMVVSISRVKFIKPLSVVGPLVNGRLHVTANQLPSFSLPATKGLLPGLPTLGRFVWYIWLAIAGGLFALWRFSLWLIARKRITGQQLRARPI